MYYKKIKLSDNGKQFYYNGKPVFKVFEEALKFHAPGLAAVKDETGWYHINCNGQAIYKKRYKQTFGYYDNRAAVTDIYGNCYHINEKGFKVYNEKYAFCGNYQENKCVIRDKKGRYFHIDIHGNRLYTECYRYVGDFKDGIACVRLENGKFLHINSKGIPLNGKMYDDLGVFHKGFATAKDKYGWFHIGKDGEAIYSERYLIIEPFYNGFSLVTNKKVK